MADPPAVGYASTASARPAVLVVGGSYWDSCVRVEPEIRPEISLTACESYGAPGGAGYSLAAAMAAVGLSVSLCSIVGSCEQSRLLVGDLVGRGVDTSRVTSSPEVIDRVDVFIDRAGTKLTVGRRELSLRLGRADRLTEAFHSGRLVAVTSPVSLRAVTDALRHAPSVSLVLVLHTLQTMELDAMEPGPRHSLLRRAGLVIANEADMALCQPAVVDSIDTLVVTRGAEGYELMISGARDAFPPVPGPVAEPKNSNGTGEAFAAAAVLGMMLDVPIRTALQAAAAYAVEHMTLPPDEAFPRADPLALIPAASLQPPR